MKESNEISPGKEGDLAAEESGISVSPRQDPTGRHYPEQSGGRRLRLTFAQFCIASTLVMLRTAFASQCNPAG